MSLVMQFKRKNITSSYNWFIEYNSEKNEEKLIIGEPPYKYNSKKYNKENSKQFKAKPRFEASNLFWDIRMSEIYLKNGIILYKDLLWYQHEVCNLNPSLGVIISSHGYREYAFRYLFNYLKCYSFFYLNKYNAFYCDKEIKEELKSRFPSIIFVQKKLNYSFELTYDDLFIEKGNYIYFLVVFDNEEYYKYNEDFWVLGKPFLKKYFFSYDLNETTMTFYREIENDEESGKFVNFIKNNFLLIILVAALILIFAIVIFVFAKCFCCKKRRNEDELKDNDDKNENLNIN